MELKTTKTPLPTYDLSDVPPNITMENYRWYVAAKYTWTFGLIFHILYIPLFFFLNIKVLAFLNIGSSVLWLIILRLHLKGNLEVSAILGIIEIALHQTMCVIIIGWRCGFQFYLMTIALGIFFMPFKRVKAIFLFIFLTSLYLALEYYSGRYDPLTPLSPFTADIIRYNIVFSVFMLFGLIGFYYNSAANKAEALLENEKSVLSQTLMERDRALEQLNQELSEAAAYVNEALPAPITKGQIKIDWRFIPSASLGGDIFGYHWIDDEHFAIYLIDVSGHGVGAALLSISIINLLRSHSIPNADYKDPGQVLESLNTTFPSEENNDMFFTMWYGVYNKMTRELTYASGGHPPALLLRERPESTSRESVLTQLRTRNHAIGALPGITFQTQTHQIEERSILYVFSDGVYEVERDDGSMWEFSEFSKFVLQPVSENQSKIEGLYNRVKSLTKSDNFEDDFTIVEVSFA